MTNFNVHLSLFPLPLCFISAVFSTHTTVYRPVVSSSVVVAIGRGGGEADGERTALKEKREIEKEAGD